MPWPATSLVRSCTGVACTALLLLGCGANKNHEERALVAGERDGCIYCIDTCRPDPGSRRADCEGSEAGYEFLSIWDFDERQGKNMYTYNDGSTPFMVPSGWQPTAGLGERWYDPEATAVGPCRPGPAMHIQGGPFRGWGGGVGISLREIWKTKCAGVEDPPDYCPPPDAEFAKETLDLSQWEGVSLWARRGPDSQPAIRVMVGDKLVDDDLAYLSLYNSTPEETFPEGKTKSVPGLDGYYAPDYPTPLYCQRVKECGCRNHKPCTEYNGEFYCFDPEVDSVPGAPREDCPLWTAEYPRCEASVCEVGHPPWPDWYDPQFNGKPCTPFSFPTSYGGKYCFDPEVDPDPVDARDKCGDYWFSPVHLSLDWEFYTVPFTEMHQQGWAMMSHYFDLTGASVMRLTWDKGWIDYWVDDVAFYRRIRD